MSKERIAVLGIALMFYAVGGWSLYGEFHKREAHTEGKWESTDAMIAAAYAQDIRDHEIVPTSLLGYRYLPKPDDPAVAMMEGDPDQSNYVKGLGLLGVGTLMALCRELILRRKGRMKNR